MRLRIVGLVLAAAALSVPRAVNAQVIHSWTLCTPGAIVSCHSVQIQTTALMSGADRVGTDVTITMHNLQGQIAADNTARSQLVVVGFGGNQKPQVDFTASGAQTWTTAGGATAPDEWTLIASSNSEGFLYIQALALQADRGIAGCVPWLSDAATCGADATVSLSFSMASIFDASSLNGVGIAAIGNQWDAEGAVFCDVPSTGGPAYTCTVLSESTTTVTPEPVTLVLLGSGLAGIGAIRSRRRRKDATL